MTPDTLRRALDSDVVRRDVVLSRFAQLKRDRRRRVRTQVIVASVAAVAVAGAAGAVHAYVQSGDSTSGSAGGCDSTLHSLSDSLQTGSSILTGHIALTGRQRDVDGVRFVEMSFSGAQTLAGPRSAESFYSWLPAGRSPDDDASNTPGLWAPDGSVVAVLTSGQKAYRGVDSTLRIAPRIGDKIIYNADQCWSAPPELRTSPWSGKLAEVPGSNALVNARSSFGGLRSGDLDDLISAIEAH